MSDPFEFSRSDDKEFTLSEAVGQAIGAGSMCWTETPKGIFHSERASEIVQALLNYIHDRDQVQLEGFAEWLEEHDQLHSRSTYPDRPPVQELVNQFLKDMDDAGQEYRAQ